LYQRKNSTKQCFENKIINKKFSGLHRD